MTLNKQKGNMYGFITHTWNPLIGQCPHNCSYCSTNKLKKRFPSMNKRYSGELRLDEKQFHSLGEGKTIFVCAQNDLFAEEVPIEYIDKVISHCAKYPENQYYFQTKNSRRMYFYLTGFQRSEPEDFLKKQIYCVTIETNLSILLMGVSANSFVVDRAMGILLLKNAGYKTNITIEPVMNFSVEFFPDFIKWANPDQVNIGADSGKNDLHEPSWGKVQKLIEKLEDDGITVWQKKNLERLKNND